MKINASIDSGGAVAGKARVPRHSFLKGAVTATAVYLAAMVSPLPAQQIGPSTTVDPYLLPSIADVKTTSILTVGDLPAENGYRMVGIPDGLGAFRRGKNLTLLMNHELGSTAGVTRAHGSKGAFVSRWTVNRKTLQVLEGQDQAQSAADVYTWDAASGQHVAGTTAWNRFCSADLPQPGAFSHGGRGTRDHILLNGEETEEGRAWAHVATGANAGEAWQLPRMGRMAYENVVASPYPQSKTVVMLMDDADLSTTPTPNGFPSDLYLYIGAKERNGHPMEKAGLTNGKLYGVKVRRPDGALVTEESNAFGLGDASTDYLGTGTFEIVELGDNGDVSDLTARQLQDATVAAQVFRMQRIEDGAWDPRRRQRNDFYFVTTASFSANSRLWRLRFDDITRPEKGGTIEILLKGNEGHKMLDNLAVDGCGRVLMQEDPGNQDHIAKVWLYGIRSGNLIEVAHHNPGFFDPALPQPATFLTRDEESSGIIDAQSMLGKGWFLVDVQAHKNITEDSELVQHGQLLAMFVDRDIECARDSGDDEDDDHDGDDN